ncbi:MAG: DUF1704 domain-containing protein, partial [Moraxellaceae bacterium]
MKNQAYLERLRGLSNQLVALQKPIRILDAIKWPADIEMNFRNNGGRELPKLGNDFYQKQKLAFDTDKVYSQLKELKSEVRKQLGKGDPLGHILQATIDQYQIVIELLRSRGTPQFGQFSRLLYGSAQDKIRGDRKTLREMGERLCHVFSLPAAEHLNRPYSNNIGAEQAVEILRERMGK